MAEFVRSDPSMWEAVYADPSVPLDRALVRQIIDDQRRLSRRWLYPIARVISRVLVALISIVKRVLPFRWMPLHTMDVAVRVVPAAVRVARRRRAAHPALRRRDQPRQLHHPQHARSTMEPVTLRPETLAGLGDQAVVEHDVNVYDVLIALDDGAADADPRRSTSRSSTSRRSTPSGERRRLLRLDIQTALCFMNIPFSMALTVEEYRRAVHSIRFDDSFLEILARRHPTTTRSGTGSSAGMSLWMDSNVDVPRMVYRHALVCEYAHARLVKLAGGAYPRQTSTEFD